MKSLLIIGYVWPEPGSSAAGARMVQLIEWAQASQFAVTFVSPAADSDYAIDLPAMGVSKHTVALNCSSFEEFIAALAPQVVIFDRFVMEEQFGWRVSQACPDALQMLDTEDLHCLREARQAALKHGEPVLVPSDARLFSEMAQRELASIYRADLTLMISDAEIELLRERFGVPSALLHHCPFMLDLPAIDGPSYEQRQHFVTIGNFRHPPNWDAIRYLHSELWPAIRSQLPQAELHIYGAYPPKKAMQLHQPKTGFHILGWADDAHAVLAQARVCLAPLRFGAGIKGKLAEAMAVATPSVTTSIGAEGMTNLGALLWPGQIADDAQAFVDAAVALYQDQSLWCEASANCAPIFSQLFDKHRHWRALDAGIGKLLANLPQHRLSNFTGAMLRHHQHRSTEFMSRWIEVKTALAKVNES